MDSSFDRAGVMSEKGRLLPQSKSGSYYTEPHTARSRRQMDGFQDGWTQRVRTSWRQAVGVVNRAWYRAVGLLHGREFFAELLATFTLCTFGNGAVAQTVLSQGTFTNSELSINIGYGFGVMLGAYISIGITGGHMNPAVTLAMALRGKTSWVKVLPYWLAQYLGAFISSAVVYGVYIDALNSFPPSACPNNTRYLNSSMSWDGNSSKTPLCTGRIWATYPAPYLSLANGFLDQVIGTFLLLLGIWAICDSQNSEPKAGMKPMLIGLLLWGIGGAFGYNCGYAINPARDFGPRAFTAMAGWGRDVFTCHNCSVRQWWWVPMTAPLVGAVLATLIYWLLIESLHPPKQTRYDPSSVNNPRQYVPPIYDEPGATKRTSPAFQ